MAYRRRKAKAKRLRTVRCTVAICCLPRKKRKQYATEQLKKALETVASGIPDAGGVLLLHFMIELLAVLLVT